jgi:hypothetical protein
MVERHLGTLRAVRYNPTADAKMVVSPVILRRRVEPMLGPGIDDDQLIFHTHSLQSIEALRQRLFGTAATDTAILTPLIQRPGANGAASLVVGSLRHGACGIGAEGR